VQVAPPCSPPPTWLQARQRASAESVSLPRRRHPCRSLSTERTLSPGPLDSPVGATSSGMPPRPPVAEAHPPPHSPEVGSAIRRAAAVRVSVTPPALLSHIRGLSARCYAPGRRRHASSALTRRRPAHGLGKLAFPERFDRPSGTPAQTRGLRVGRRFCAPSQIRCGRALTPAWRRHRPPRRAGGADRSAMRSRRRRGRCGRHRAAGDRGHDAAASVAEEGRACDGPDAAFADGGDHQMVPMTRRLIARFLPRGAGLSEHFLRIDEVFV